MEVKKNIGLVLEGGGFRGCYTAGALSWLLDHDIHIQWSASISAATTIATYYAAGDKEGMFNATTKHLKDKEVIGLSPLFREGTFVGYDYLRRNNVLPNYKAALEKLKANNYQVEVGLYNMTKQQLQYFGKESFDSEAMLLMASCVLPISGKMTTLFGDQFLDGGIRTMVSIDHAIETGHDKNLVIVTKDASYVRKPNSFALTTLLKIVYHKFKTMLATLDKRVDTYYYEMGKVQQLQDEGKAILIRPSKDCGVGRFSGSYQQMEEMYQLGWQDMEDHKEELMKFLEEE